MNISTLSNWDVLMLQANFDSSFKTKCDEMVKRFVKKGYEYEVAKRHVSKKNHCTDSSFTPFYELDNFILYTCPCNFKHPNFNLFLKMQNMLEKGVLPESGSYLDQSNYIMEGIDLVDYLKSSFEVEQLKKQKSKK